MAFRISVDAGGTFTDGVSVDEKGEFIVAKADTTPQDPTIGTINCIKKLASGSGMNLKDFFSRAKNIIHSTTLATNVIATRSGAKVGTISTKGFGVRMVFPQVPKTEWKEHPVSMYDFRLEAPQPLTRPYLMTEVEERVNFKGEVLTPLNEESVRKSVRYLKKHKVESIAVMLMFSPVYPDHEQRIAEIIKEEYPDVVIALSSTVLPAIGEFERWSTTLFSAYVAPTIVGYVSKLQGILKKEGFAGELLFMQSNGGIATPDIIIENPAALLLSGPAAGPSIGLILGSTHSAQNILSVDMGGTSFDIGVVHDGVIDIVQEQIIDAKKFSLPSVDVTTIGAGGGSIAHVDPMGRLQVGPKSAGASPGPVCYGQGGEDPTVTDADVVLGYIDPEFFLGGERKLRKDLAEKSIKEKIADPLGVSVTEAAAAIYSVINARMAGGTDTTFTQRGYDPRDFVICAAGGAAPVHTVPLMKELGIKKAIIPKVSPIYCAFGMLFCDLKHDYQRAYLCETAKADLGKINELYAEMEKAARDTLRREGVAEKDIVIEKSVEMRYYGQFRQRTAEVPAGPVTKKSLKTTVANFNEVHRKTLGYARPDYPTEIVRLRLTATALVSKPKLKAASRGAGGSVSRALKKTRQAYFPGHGFIATEVYDGDKLCPGDSLKGPCIIEEKFTTIVLPPEAVIEVDSGGNYLTNVEEV